MPPVYQQNTWYLHRHSHPQRERSISSAPRTKRMAVCGGELDSTWNCESLEEIAKIYVYTVILPKECTLGTIKELLAFNILNFIVHSTAGLSNIKISVTHRMNPTTFASINKLGSGLKKKGKKKKGKPGKVIMMPAVDSTSLMTSIN